MRFLGELNVEQPKLFRMLAEFALNTKLRDALHQDTSSAQRIKDLLRQAGEMNLALDTETLEFTLRRKTETLARAFWANPTDEAVLEKLESTIRLAREMPFKVNLWQVQNLYAKNVDGNLDRLHEVAKDAGPEWLDRIRMLGESLDFRVKTLEEPVPALQS